VDAKSELKMAKKFKSSLCGRLNYLVKDERKAQVEYLNLEEKVRASNIPRKDQLAKALSDISKDETKHELKLDWFHNELCRKR